MAFLEDRIINRRQEQFTVMQGDFHLQACHIISTQKAIAELEAVKETLTMYRDEMNEQR